MTSTCSKCGNHSFEIQENSPARSRYMVWMVQCSSCGSVVGALEYFDSGVELQEQKRSLQHIGSAVDGCASRISALEAEVRKLANMVKVS